MNPDFIKKRLPYLLGAALALGVVLLYLPTLRFEFILLDDRPNIVQSDLVREGLTLEGVRDVVTKTYKDIWTPLYWLSFMADIELFGLNPGGFHGTNVVLFAVNALLLFAFLHRATGSPWKSFFAALLWALHPMRVESVAWVTERKDLLSGMFFLLTLLAWGEYANKRKPGWYFAALFSMFLGLASKPILVVIPLALLIADLWPLERLNESIRKLVLEKIPFFALSLIFSLLTMSLQKKSIITTEDITLPERLMDMATSYLFYLYETIWPLNLAMMDRPTAPHFRGYLALGAALFLIAATCMAVWARKKSPAVTAGWLWYLAVLLPVSGIVPTGFYFVADHFTYLPHMGLSIGAVWGLDELSRGNGNLRKGVLALLCLCLFAEAAISAAYIPKWKDSETLFAYFYEKTGSSTPELKLATNYIEQRDFSTALEILDRAIGRNPSDFRLHQRMGQALLSLGRREEAAMSFEKAAELNAGLAGERLSLGQEAFEKRDYALARRHALKALKIDGGDRAALFLLGATDLMTGRRAEALENFRQASEISGGDAELLKRIGLFLAQNKEPGAASEYFEKVLALDPGNPDNSYNLALSLLESGQTGRAKEYFIKTIALDPEGLDARFNLARLLQSEGRLAEARKEYDEILRIRPSDEEARKALDRLSERN